MSRLVLVVCDLRSLGFGASLRAHNRVRADLRARNLRSLGFGASLRVQGAVNTPSTLPPHLRSLGFGASLRGVRHARREIHREHLRSLGFGASLRDARAEARALSGGLSEVSASERHCGINMGGVQQDAIRKISEVSASELH